MTSYPRLGVPGVFTEPYSKPEDAISSHSLFVPEEITNPHARFPLVLSRLKDWLWLKLLFRMLGRLLRTFVEDEVQK